MKIVLTGYPKTGKTTLANQLLAAGYKVLHTDDAIALGIHNDSAAIAEWFNEPGDWVIEGVTAPRAIRKWLEQHPGRGFPADLVVYLTHHVVPWESKGTFIKSIDTVFSQVRGHVRLGTKQDVERVCLVQDNEQ